MVQPSEKEIHNGIIKSYRVLIDERYAYKNLISKYELPPSFDEKRVERFKYYFLENLYPDVEKREELNEAFESLDAYIRHPEKLLRVLVDSASLLFKYGRHLRKILGSGIKALQSFRTANQFEHNLINAAISQKINPPYDSPTLKNLIRTLPTKDIEHFIKSNETLFSTFQDRVLVSKIKEIVTHLITKMKKRPKTYSPIEIRGIEIGFEIIEKGDMLFQELTEEEQQMIFEFIVQVEKDALGEIFNA